MTYRYGELRPIVILSTTTSGDASYVIEYSLRKNEGRRKPMEDTQIASDEEVTEEPGSTINEMLFGDPLARAMGIATVATIETKEKWRADTPRKGEFVIGKVINIRQLAADVKANAAALVKALEQDADRLESYFEDDLRSLGMAILSQEGYNPDGSLKKKTWKTVVGELAFRTNADRIEIPNSRSEDKARLVSFCEENLLDVYEEYAKEAFPGCEPDEIPPLVRETTVKDVLLTTVKPLLRLDTKIVPNEEDGDTITIENVVVEATGELVPFALVKPKESMKISQSSAAKSARKVSALTGGE